jgi:hypothetical protein
MVPFWFFMTQFLQEVKGYRPIIAGLAFLPTTLPNFASAMAVPRLTKWIGSGWLMIISLGLSVIGMVWLGQVDADSSYIWGVALPMMLVGIGQGGTLGPITASGVAGVSGTDAGAASGVVNVAHQLGGSLGLGVLVVVAAFATRTALESPATLAHRAGAALMGSSVLLGLALAVVLVLIVYVPAGRGGEMKNGNEDK